MLRGVRWLIVGMLPVLSALPAGGGTEGAGNKAPAPDPTLSGRATLRGRVTLDGERPDIGKMNDQIRKQMEGHKDAQHCLKGSKDEISQQTWVIDGRGGVANVFVWLQPAEGEYFKLDRTHLDPKTGGWPAEVVLDQPHCAYVPHAFVLFPSYYDPETRQQKPTGQKFLIKNSADFPHNTNWTGVGKNKALGDNRLIPAKGQFTVPPLHPHPVEITFRCDLHQWMHAYARIFDHPFATVTRKDGTYEIKNAPAEVPIQVIAWHEAGRYLNGDRGETITLKEGENSRDFKVRVK